jgi:hypothetical protein
VKSTFRARHQREAEGKHTHPNSMASIRIGIVHADDKFQLDGVAGRGFTIAKITPR